MVLFRQALARCRTVVIGGVFRRRWRVSRRTQAQQQQPRWSHGTRATLDYTLYQWTETTTTSRATSSRTVSSRGGGSCRTSANVVEPRQPSIIIIIIISVTPANTWPWPTHARCLFRRRSVRTARPVQVSLCHGEIDATRSLNRRASRTRRRSSVAVCRRPPTNWLPPLGPGVAAQSAAAAVERLERRRRHTRSTDDVACWWRQRKATRWMTRSLQAMWPRPRVTCTRAAAQRSILRITTHRAMQPVACRSVEIRFARLPGNNHRRRRWAPRGRQAAAVIASCWCYIRCERCSTITSTQRRRRRRVNEGRTLTALVLAPRRQTLQPRRPLHRRRRCRSSQSLL